MSKTNNRAVRRDRRRSSIRKKISGLPDKPRLAVFRSAKHIYVQAIDDTTGKTLAAASSCDKDTRGKLKYTGNCDSASAVGKALAERLSKLGIDKAVFDRGGNPYHGRVKALADGAREGGIQF